MELATTTKQQPLTLMPPISASGCIRNRGQADYFHIPLTQNQPVSISVESLSLSSPMVPLLALRDPEQKVVAEIRETGKAREAAISHTPTQAGEYSLTIRDRYGHGGDRYFYRLTITPTQPDFALAMDRDSIVLSPEKPFDLPLTVTRQQGNGEPVTEIRIEAIDLPPGVTAEPVVSKPDGDTSGKVTIQLKTDGTPFSGPIRVRGSAKELSIDRYATAPPKFGARLRHIWLTVRQQE